MGTLIPNGILTHDHYGKPNGRSGSLEAFRQYDWIAFRGHRNTFFVRPRNFNEVGIEQEDVGILKITPLEITPYDIGTPIRIFHYDQPLNPGDQIYGAYVPGVGNFGNNHCQDWSCIQMSVGIMEREWNDDVAGDGRPRSHAFAALWDEPALFASGESGSGVFNKYGWYVGSASGGPVAEVGFAVYDRLISP
jgi:hypothetical protein